eukprot:TRINITY_DN10937_c0_g1_i3.p2 TRINITY_DN10937_c0_g1~~TRINITY_DN10937_c0_g1_i3.p2  ORF type:complete len:418 (+),score=48.31 TRINITY_DN10937_c0_g1_i3:1028-2281(+)
MCNSEECDAQAHLRCIPSGEPDQYGSEAEVLAKGWSCRACRPKEIHHKKEKRASLGDLSDRKWGGGMSCAGVHSKCEFPDAPGSVPLGYVGFTCNYRVHMSGSGYHRPPVGGISGSRSKPATSIVFAMSYSDDIDHGDTIIYTGSGGTDLSGNKRTSEQAHDQELTIGNEALINAYNAMSPVRVIRDSKACKRAVQRGVTTVAPENGLRYDGLYQVIDWRYVVSKNTRLRVFEYELRRVDTTPPPWETQKYNSWLEGHRKKLLELIGKAVARISETSRPDPLPTNSKLDVILEFVRENLMQCELSASILTNPVLVHGHSIVQHSQAEQAKFRCPMCNQAARSSEIEDFQELKDLLSILLDPGLTGLKIKKVAAKPLPTGVLREKPKGARAVEPGGKKREATEEKVKVKRRRVEEVSD